MKATVWLWPIVTLICISPFVCTSAQQEFQEFPSDSNMIQDDYLLEKRTKPSLSIVNPLDVLRQRLLLEIARRQMKENTRQVEINRAILKNVGKRGNHHIQQQHLLEEHLPQLKLQQASPLRQQNQQLLQQQLQQQKHYQMSPSSFLEFLRRENDKKTTTNDYNLISDGGGIGATGSGISENENIDGINDIDGNNSAAIDGGGADDDYQIRYLYRLHKNRYSKK